MIHVYKTPRLLKAIYPSLIWEKESKDQLYLTFDDGPHPEATNWVLDELARFNASATFFSIGQHINNFKKISERVVSEGHLIANHTNEHERGWETENKKYFQSVTDCEKEIESVQKVRTRLFRPPYGRIKKNTN